MRRMGFVVNGTSGLVESSSKSGKLGEYFGTAVQKRKVHWPKGQVVANLFRSQNRAAAAQFSRLQRKGFVRINRISGSQIVRKSLVTRASEANVSQRAVACPRCANHGRKRAEC